MKSKPDALWIAEQLAHADDDTQAEFFNEFFRCLRLVCRDKVGNQVCFIADKIAPDTARELEEMISYFKAK